MSTSLLRSFRIRNRIPFPSHTNPTPSQRTFTTSRSSLLHHLNVNENKFKSQVLDRKDGKIVLVDFYADWCGPCKIFTPILKNVVPNDAPQDIITIDIDENQEIARKYQISSIPTLIAFKDGEPINKTIGVIRENDLKLWVKSLEGARY